MKKLHIMLVAGARPNFMKIAPILHAFKKYKNIACTLVHTGQHYDKKLSGVFFKELGIPSPKYNLGIGSGTHAEQTGKILIAFDALLGRVRPDLVMVVGDVNSTIACALAAKKRGIRVAHVEAGLRSFDWSMPEEINRVLTDRISDFLFCSEKSGVVNLKHEGVAASRIFFVGNVMIDTLLRFKKQAERESSVLKTLGLHEKKYAVVTLHRPSNVDDKKTLERLMQTLRRIAHDIPVIFPVHPRTEKNIKVWNIKSSGVTVLPPLGYLDFLKLISHARLVLTDSGGIQEETTVLGVPCLTLRRNTERPVTLHTGTNQLVGMDPKKILKAVSGVLKGRVEKTHAHPPLWDGRAAQRIVRILSTLDPETSSG